jgi:hypothetical protein
MLIREFVQRRAQEESQWISVKDWNAELAELGYHPAQCHNLREWQEVHAWCREFVGEQHYAWAGNCFWFETADVATLFSLRWS